VRAAAILGGLLTVACAAEPSPGETPSEERADARVTLKRDAALLFGTDVQKAGPDLAPAPVDASVADAAVGEVGTDAASADALTVSARRSAGCGKAAPQGDPAQALKLQHQGKDRTYHLSLPPSYDPQRPLALVVALHPAGPNYASGWRTKFGMGKATTGEGQAVFVYPQSLLYGGRSQWELTDEEVGFVDAIAAHIANVTCIDLDRVFLMGFSSGGKMTYHRACRKPGPFKAFVAAGADATESASGCVAGARPVVIMYGTKEEEFAAWQRTTLPAWLRQNGCGADKTPSMPSPCMASSGCQSPTISCAFDGGHVWPPFGAQAAWNLFGGR
jgi:polyhydroxybutyrate depolymerase